MSRYFFSEIDKSPDYGYIPFMVHVQDQECTGAVSGAAVYSLYLLQRTGAGSGVDLGREEAARDLSDGVNRRLLCRVCGSPVTSEAERIAINGSHDHIFRNPGGVVFHVGCFTDAKGCLVVGAFTEEYTWFSGFEWCYAVCSGCHVHLGWRYESNGEGFFGLILDRLVRR